MKSFIQSTSRFCYNRSLGLLLIRIAIGSLFLTHGLMKVENIGRTTAMFMGMGFPSWVGIFIGWLEVIGGAALILGIGTRVFGALFGIEMLVAVLITGPAKAFGGLELLLALASFGIALAGSGRYSLYAMECENCNGMLCNPKDAMCPPEKK